MAIHEITHRNRHDAHRRHLVTLEQIRDRRTIYTDPRRATRLVKALIVACILATTSVLSFIFGYDLLIFLCRATAVLFVVALIWLISALLIDTMKEPDA